MYPVPRMGVDLRDRIALMCVFGKGLGSGDLRRVLGREGGSFDFGSGLYIQPQSAGCTTHCLRSGRTGDREFGWVYKPCFRSGRTEGGRTKERGGSGQPQGLRLCIDGSGEGLFEGVGPGVVDLGQGQVEGGSDGEAVAPGCAEEEHGHFFLSREASEVFQLVRG